LLAGDRAAQTRSVIEAVARHELDPFAAVERLLASLRQ
jgi:hypothetical protein